MSEQNPSDSELALFLRDHDLVWELPPTRWQEAPFIGNGLSGALLLLDLKNNCIKWFLGRTDVGRLDYPGKARDPIRIQIGSVLQVLHDGIRILGCSLRLDLWNAEIRGTVRTDKGDLELRAFAPSGSNSIIVESTAGNPDLNWEWECGIKGQGVLSVCEECSTFVADDFVAHPRTDVASGGFAVVWGERPAGPSSKRLICSIGSTPVNRRLWNDQDCGVSAKEEAARDFGKFRDAASDGVLERHRDWWHAFHGRSFLSFSNRELESLYWIQLYKFASTTRPDRPMIDNHGIWSAHGTYGFATWDFNVQSTYRVHLTANHLDFGKPLLKFLEDSFNPESMWDAERGEFRAGMRQQTFLRYRFFDRKHWEHGEELPCEGPAKFLWGVHNYCMHYRHSLDKAMIPRMVLMLEAGINAMLDGLKLEDDGFYHIPYGRSWEAWFGRDPSGLLAVFRWALATAIEHSGEAGVPEEKRCRWAELLEKIAPYPENESGYLLGEGQPPIPHRHWTQLMMLYPLDIADPSNPLESQTLRKSIDFWAHISAGLDGKKPDAGFACPAAIALYAYLHASTRTSGTALIPELADIFLYRETDRNPGLWPATMYSEWTGPVIETPLFMASAIQACFLQSRRDGIHVFRAVPDAWPDVTFADWHAEGNFLLSASRRDGRTEWIAVESLSGVPVKLHTDLPLADIYWNGVKASGRSGQHSILDDHTAELRLDAGQRLVLSAAAEPGLRISPVAKRFGLPNSFGLNRNFLAKRPDFDARVRELMDRLCAWDTTVLPGEDPFSP